MFNVFFFFLLTRCIFAKNFSVIYKLIFTFMNDFIFKNYLKHLRNLISFLGYICIVSAVFSVLYFTILIFY